MLAARVVQQVWSNSTNRVNLLKLLNIHEIPGSRKRRKVSPEISGLRIRSGIAIPNRKHDIGDGKRQTKSACRDRIASQKESRRHVAGLLLLLLIS